MMRTTAILAAALLTAVAAAATTTVPPAQAASLEERTKAVSPFVDADGVFVPPARDQLPAKDGDRAMAELGRKIFTETPTYAPDYVGNGMKCVNCHLDEGRKAGSAPMWAAWVLYPKYRAKNDRVNTMEERLRGCFRYSMNGRMPEPGSETLVALQSYMAWLATGLPWGAVPKGQGYDRLADPALPYDPARGEAVYAEKCAVCHGDDGEGQAVSGSFVFPPLWGEESYNWGAGMHRVWTAAAFIKANMPLGQGNTLTDQEAWDVAAWINTKPRPQDPRFTGDVQETREKFHNDGDYYGVEWGGVVHGSPDSVVGRIGGRHHEAVMPRQPGAADAH